MRRILIVTGGLSPAVVTETLWALAVQGKPTFWPEQVIVVVTASVASRYRDVLGGSNGKIAELATYLGKSKVPELEVAYTACDDIRSHADAVAFGDKVCDVVQRETRNADALLHLSLAGGRKTMSFHGGAAMTLFGRPQDELSHVLVTPQALEGCPDFWWPTREERWVPHRDQKGNDGNPRLYNTQQGRDDDRASIDLALIPFVRVRGRLPEIMLTGRMSYDDYVAQVNAGIEGRGGIVLELLTDACTLRIANGAVTIKLEPQDFAVYRLLAEWAKARVPGCGPDGIGAIHCGWLSASMLRDPGNVAVAGPRNPVARLLALGDEPLAQRITPSPAKKIQADENYKFVGQALGRIRTMIRESVTDAALASRLLGKPAGGRKPSNPPRFGILLAPHEIAIRPYEGGPEIAPFVHIARTNDSD